LRAALCFPGQGSQSAGMASSLMHEPMAAALLDAAAAEAVDLRLLLRGDAAGLRPTQVAQPALLFVECVLLELVSRHVDVVAVAGHSVGEYSACVAAAALDPVAAMRLVIARGRAMAATREGTMMAFLGLPDEAVAAVCVEATRQTGETVVVANFNAPGQVVVSGTPAAVDAARRLARERGLRRAIALEVTGAFHSPLMEDAAASFGAALDAVPLRDPRVPVVCNVDGAPASDAATLRDRLRRQLTSAVRWVDCVRGMAQLGADTLIEIGPGSVLTGLTRRIAPEVRAVAINDAAAARALTASTATP